MSRLRQKGEPMSKRFSYIPFPNEDVESFNKDLEALGKYIDRQKRKWEDAFQRWSNKNGIESDNITSHGCCGYGSMCDWCVDNSYGRPCVRALNAMLREEGLCVNHENLTEEYFIDVWNGKYKERQ